MLVNFSDKEMRVIQQLAKLMDISEEKVVILALRHYQLALSNPERVSDSPGCGLVE